MIDLTTPYLGLDLASPVVASASPLTGQPETARLLEESGASAVVMPSLFEEEILHEEIEMHRSIEAGSDQHAEATGYFPKLEDLPGVSDRYLTQLESLKARLSVPVIASLNASHPGGWASYARLLEDAGADALELNLYRVAADPTRTSHDVEQDDLEIVASVRSSVRIPLAVKLSPYYSSMASFAQQVVDAGADGLVVFNRFYQPDIDLETLDVVHRVELSRPWELRLPLRWLAILRPQLGPTVSLAATSGVHSGYDVVKALMVGADVAMLTSAVLQHGAGHLRTVHDELRRWMEAHGYTSVDQLRGSATQETSGDPSSFERASYVAALHSWSTPAHLLVGDHRATRHPDER
ncbi:MAG: dihydroorotate dehydrogenase-like protein [Acidimicrobiia bacterium]